MRTLASILAAIVLTAVAAPARAQECTCNDHAATIVLKGSAGTLVACDTLQIVDPAHEQRSVVTFAIEDADAAAISAKLTELYGAEVVFSPADEGTRLDV